jgi:uncharacterized repeat protein (TIGR01451 family)
MQKLFFLIGAFMFLNIKTTFAQQGEYKIAYNAATQTYTVYGKVNTSYANPMSRFVNVFVTVMAPHGSGAARFVPTSIATDATLATSNVVTVTRLDAPSYLPTKDYLFFNFDVGSSAYAPQPITANTEFPIFSFQSQNGCVGDLYIIDHSSAEYSTAQANSINAGNALSILGAGGDTYSANYGGNAVCAIMPPTITVGFTSPLTAGQNGTMTITATNSSGNPAQSGMGYTYTLPTGLSFPTGATVTNSCGGTATISGNTVTFTGGTMASGMATCTISAPVVAASAGTINPSTGSFSSSTQVTVAPNNGVGVSPTNITVNPAACAANAGVLSQ